MGLIRMGPPETLILTLQQRLGIAEFVETGTFQGDTAAWAARHFTRVTTIELSPGYHAAAVERFKGQANITTLCGDSSAMLKEVLRSLTTPAFFWLDAHWSGLDTAGRESECPLLEEIQSINGAGPMHTILVDDARLFCAPPPRPHRAAQWPDLVTTVTALSKDRRRYVVMVDDVFVAVPASEQLFLTNWLQSHGANNSGESGFARLLRRLRA